MPLTDWCRTISLKHAHGFERGVARQNGAWLRGYRTYGSHMAYESFMKTYPLCLLAIALLGFSSLATTRVPASPTLADYVTEANAAYYDLPRSLSAYNSAIRGICQAIQTGATQEFAASLDKLGVSFNPPSIRLPLRWVQIAGSSPGSTGPKPASRWCSDTKRRPRLSTRRKGSSWMPPQFTIAQPE